MTKHTPTPWFWNGNWLNGQSDGTLQNNGLILWYTTGDNGIHCRPEDAAFISKACNSHDSPYTHTLANTTIVSEEQLRAMGFEVLIGLLCHIRKEATEIISKVKDKP